MGGIYLAGKVGADEQLIDTFAEELEARGHQITLKWWKLPKLSKPFLDFQDSSRAAADSMVQAVREADTAVILFPEDNILGAMVEFGVAIGSRPKQPSREIIVVNPYEVRQSVFYATSEVIAVRSLAAVRQRPWY